MAAADWKKAAKADVSVETGWWWRGGGEKAEAGRDIFKGQHQDDKLTMKVRCCTSDRWDQLISQEWLQEIESWWWWWWWSDKLTSWLNSQSFISSKLILLINFILQMTLFLFTAYRPIFLGGRGILKVIRPETPIKNTEKLESHGQHSHTFSYNNN